MKNLTLYCDLDGVLANFDKQLKLALKMIGKDENASKSQKWKAVSYYNKYHGKFFQTLEKMDKADMLMDFLLKNFNNVEILTASGSTPSDVKAQKRKWYTETFGNGIKVNVVGSGLEKAAFAHESAILLDDTEKNITAFKNAGGIGVLYDERNYENVIKELEGLSNG